MVDTTTSVNFFPTKRLLVDIITKDINVHDSILDLIDNSVDSYIRHKFKDQKEVKISIDEKRLCIEDTCGGIPQNFLKEHVFRAGEPPPECARTIGYYGIGLKRALFKLAKEFVLETFDGKEYSKVELNVENWLKNNDWDVPLITKNGTFTKKTFTRINITKYRDNISRILDTKFINDLNDRLSIYYTRFIEKNQIKFTFNNNSIKPFDLAPAMSKEYEPANLIDKYDDIEIKITCWIEPRSKPRESRELGKQGWNIFMNDRLILIDDISPITGWSGIKSELPKDHPIYYEFRGIVFLISPDPGKLPLNTTKNGFNLENPAYHYVKQKMVATARPLITYLSKKYDETKIRDQEAEIEKEINNESKQQTDPKRMSIDEFKTSQTFKSPPPKPKPDIITISYKKPRKRVEKIMERYDKKRPIEVGELTFDYFWNFEGLDDE